MLVRIAICDDEPDSIATIQEELEKSGNQLEIPLEIQRFTDGMELMDSICNHKAKEIDVLFLDIDMPEISGLEVAKRIRDAHLDITLIFISAHEQYVFESMEYSPFRYIRKMKMKEEIQPALKALYQKLQSEMTKKVIVKTEEGDICLDHGDIMYFEMELRRVKIYRCDGTVYVTRMTIKELYEKLNNEDFIQINRGCFVNAKYVEECSHMDITLDNGTQLEVSRRKMKEVREMIMKYWRSKI